MPFGITSWLGPRNSVLRGVTIPEGVGAIWRENMYPTSLTPRWDRGRRLIASVGRVYYRSRRGGLHIAGEVWYLQLPCLLLAIDRMITLIWMPTSRCFCRTGHRWVDIDDVRYRERRSSAASGQTHSIQTTWRVFSCVNWDQAATSAVIWFCRLKFWRLSAVLLDCVFNETIRDRQPHAVTLISSFSLPRHLM